MNEAQIQAACVLKFSQEYPERRGDLFATFQETTNAIQGSNMLSKGLVSGVSDLILLNDGVLTGIEMKAPDTRHNLIHILEQCRFLLHNCHDGWFCVSMEQFQNIVTETGLATDPLDVVDLCIEKIETKIELAGSESIDDLIFLCNKYEKKSGKKMPTIKF